MTRNHAAPTFFAALALLAIGCGPGPTPTDAGHPPGDAGHDDTGPSPVDAATVDAPQIDAYAEPDAGEVAPTFRNAVSLDDAALAHEALRLMGASQAGGSGSCSDCHAISRPNIAHFLDLSNTAWSTCFSDLTVPTQAAAQAIVACFQDATTHTYHTGNLGIFATGATFDWFRFVFRRAYGTGWETEYDRFANRVQQSPSPYPAFTQAEFDTVTEWFLRGTPQVGSIIPVMDGPGVCTSYVDPSVGALVAEGAASGWSARNMEAGILMHGCAGAASPADCLAAMPRVTTTTYGAAWETPGTHQHVLFDVPYHSSYWTRSSADGRFVAHGGGTGGASIIDLVRGVVIPTSAAYDPGFFPDNSGFLFQGTPYGAALCNQSVLTTGTPTSITFAEAGCSHPTSIGLYEHVGASLDGGDYFVVNSLWSGDPGDALQDPQVFVDPSAMVTLIRLTNTGAGFAAGGSVQVTAPYQGNAVISPTMRLLVTQLADVSGAPLGYVLHRIDLTRDAAGAVTSVAIPEIARYCVPGGKAAVSLDDRWLITHHRATDADAVDLGFTGPTDPAFAPYRGVSNVYLIDIATGHETRITNMQPGQRALFPHFRSDGWIYFLARTSALPEHVIATDAALVLH